MGGKTASNVEIIENIIKQLEILKLNYSDNSDNSDINLSKSPTNKTIIIKKLNKDDKSYKMVSFDGDLDKLKLIVLEKKLNIGYTKSNLLWIGNTLVEKKWNILEEYFKKYNINIKIEQ